MNVKPKRTQVNTHDMAGDLFIQYVQKKKSPKLETVELNVKPYLQKWW